MENKKEYKDYVTYCKDFIIDGLTDCKGYLNSEYACDLGYKLTERINVDGSATYSTYEAKQYIKEWWNEAGEVYEYQKDNYGECLQNPFENPEAFHVVMIIEGVNNILNQCETIQENWNDEIELTDEVINKLIEEVEDVREIEF
jgi:hypothetical protein